MRYIIMAVLFGIFIYALIHNPENGGGHKDPHAKKDPGKGGH